MFAIAALLQESGLTLRKVITDIPHDVPAMVVYLLLGAFVFLIWRGSRPSRP